MAGSKFFGKKRKAGSESISSEELEQLLSAAIESPPEQVEVRETLVEQEKTNQMGEVSSLNLHKAHNVYRDSKLNKYMLVTIEYDINTGYCKVVGTEPIADDIGVAIYKLSNKFSLKLFRQEEVL
jgi:hypothetical protein